MIITSPPATDGVDVAGIGRSVRPGDDFFAYANGIWTKATEIPPDRFRYGVSAILAEEAILRTCGILEDGRSIFRPPTASASGNS